MVNDDLLNDDHLKEGPFRLDCRDMTLKFVLWCCGARVSVCVHHFQYGKLGQAANQPINEHVNTMLTNHNSWKTCWLMARHGYRLKGELTHNLSTQRYRGHMAIATCLGAGWAVSWRSYACRCIKLGSFLLEASREQTVHK